MSIGEDATEAFEDVGHSEDARHLLKDYEIGVLDPADAAVKASPKKGYGSSASKDGEKSSGEVIASLLRVAVTLAVLLGGFYYFQQQQK